MQQNPHGVEEEVEGPLTETRIRIHCDAHVTEENGPGCEHITDFLVPDELLFKSLLVIIFNVQINLY